MNYRLLALSSLLSSSPPAPRTSKTLNTNPNAPVDVQPSLLLRQVTYDVVENLSYEGFTGGANLGQYFSADPGFNRLRPRGSARATVRGQPLAGAVPQPARHQYRAREKSRDARQRRLRRSSPRDADDRGRQPHRHLRGRALRDRRATVRGGVVDRSTTGRRISTKVRRAPREPATAVRGHGGLQGAAEAGGRPAVRRQPRRLDPPGQLAAAQVPAAGERAVECRRAGGDRADRRRGSLHRDQRPECRLPLRCGAERLPLRAGARGRLQQLPRVPDDRLGHGCFR